MKKLLTLFLLTVLFPVNIFAADDINLNLNQDKAQHPSVNIMNVIAYGDDFMPKEEYLAGDDLKGAMQIISSDNRFFSDAQYSTYLELYSTSTMPSFQGFLLATSTLFNITPNETITNPISVKLPENIGGDDLYVIRVDATLKTGQWLGSSKSQPFKIVQGEKQFSINDRAVIALDKEGQKFVYDNSIGPSIYKENGPDKAQMSFSVLNPYSESKEVSAQISFDKIDDFQSKEFPKINQKINLQSGTSTNVLIDLPNFDYIQGLYMAKLQLFDDSGKIKSAENTFAYAVDKESVVIINYASVDKVSVLKGEALNLKVGYYGFTLEDTFGPTSTPATIKPFNLEVKLFNEFGDLIGQSSKIVSEASSKETVFEIQALRTAKAMKAEVIVSRNNQIINIQNFTLTSDFEKIAEQSKKDYENFINKIILASSVLVIILIIILIIILKTKKKKLSKSIYSLFALVLFVFGVSSLNLANNVFAYYGLSISTPSAGAYFYEGASFGIGVNCNNSGNYTICPLSGINTVVSASNPDKNETKSYILNCSPNPRSQVPLFGEITQAMCNASNNVSFTAANGNSSHRITAGLPQIPISGAASTYKSCPKNVNGGMIYISAQCSTCTVSKTSLKVGEAVTYSFPGLTSNAYFPVTSYFTWNKPGAFVSSASNKGVSYTGSYNTAGSFNMTMTNALSGIYGGGTATCPTVTVTSPINGVCGSSNNKSTLNAPTTNLCTTGTASSVTAGASSFTWNCTGSGGGTNSSCSAPRTYATVNGSCGTAKKNYLNTATSYGLDTFCSTGTASPATPAFPAKGGSQTWQCLGSGTVPGSSVSCTATRNADLSCTGPDGVTIASGSSKIYYSSNSSANCSSLAQTRTCTNGSLSGTATYASCSAPAASCTGPDGSIISSGSSKTYYIYQNTLSCSNTSQIRDCSNGVLGGNGTYQYATCLNSCTGPDGTTINSGSSKIYYSSNSSANCSSLAQTRTCTNGSLSGSNTYPSCTAPVTSCSIPTPNPNNISICSLNKICATSGMCNNLTSPSGITKVSMRMTPNITSNNICSIYWTLTSDQNTILYCGVYNSNNVRVDDQSADIDFQVNPGTYQIKCFSDQAMTNPVINSETKTCVKNPEVKEI